MNELPSTSKMRAPDARAMKSGEPPTALKARTGEFTPPGVTRFARSKSFDDLRGLFTFTRRGGSLDPPQEPSGSTREVGNDHVRARASNRGERFHHRPLFLDPSVLRGSFDHRVLAAHLVRGGR